MKILAAVFLSLFVSLVHAKESYIFVIPNTPGSVSDLVARSMANIYNKKTGNTLVIQNVGGGQQIPATVKFATLNTPAIAMTTTGILVFNPVIQKSLPYSLDIFDHVGGISYAPIVWVVRADSPYKNMQDLVNNLPTSKKPLVAYANLVEVINFHVIANKNNWNKNQVEPVKYKGVPEAVQGLLAGDLEVAVVSYTKVIGSQIQAGKLRAIGTTLPKTYTADGIDIASVKQQIGVDQYTGGVFIALNKYFKPEEAAKLKKDIYEIMADPEFIQDVIKFGGIPFENNNSNENIIRFAENFRNIVRLLNLNLQ
jgi:tripartite-type tricarboxylate transporter receptor subunit TctC